MSNAAVMGLRVIESPLALSTQSMRVYRHRRNQTTRYHTRVQKKWTKRYGTKIVPGAYILGRHTLVIHPKHMAQLRAEGNV